MAETLIERVAKSIDDELARQHKDEDLGYYHPRSTGEDWNTVDGNILITPLARAVILAMREPTEAMLLAAYKAQDESSDPIGWEAMIDAALEDHSPGT